MNILGAFKDAFVLFIGKSFLIRTDNVNSTVGDTRQKSEAG